MKYSCFYHSLNIDEGLVTNIFLLFKLFLTSVQNPLLWVLNPCSFVEKILENSEVEERKFQLNNTQFIMFHKHGN